MGVIVCHTFYQRALTCHETKLWHEIQQLCSAGTSVPFFRLTHQHWLQIVGDCNVIGLYIINDSEYIYTVCIVNIMVNYFLIIIYIITIMYVVLGVAFGFILFIPL